ncbi:MAG: hypothetical protein QNJ33_08110 [Crocosphaera sp.]|nr:hypothetical protein [Crocosphaera sp.]
MLINADVSIPFSRSLVYLTYRDKLMELLPYMPNVRSVEVQSRYEENQQIYCVNLWHGGGNIPLTVRTVIGEALMSWIEYNTWNESDFTLEWRIETKAFTEAVFCAGKNRFLEENGTTIIQTRGELKIDPQKIHGLSGPLKGKVAHAVENFLGKKIVPNLVQMGKGVHHYLDKRTHN